MVDCTARIERETDKGLETVNVRLPAVLTTDLRLNGPRFASLPDVMKARKKPIEEKTAADLGVDTTPRLAVLGVKEPAARAAGVKVKSVAELLDKLQQVGVI